MLPRPKCFALVKPWVRIARLSDEADILKSANGARCAPYMAFGVVNSGQKSLPTLPDLQRCTLIIPKQSANRPYRRTNRPAKYHRQHSDEKLNAANRKPVAHSHV